MSLRVEPSVPTGGVQMMAHRYIQGVRVHVNGQSLLIGWINPRGEEREVFVQDLVHHSLMRVDVLFGNAHPFGRTSSRVRRYAS